MGNPPKQNLTRWYFTLALIEGLGVMVWLVAQSLPMRGVQASMSVRDLPYVAPALILVIALAWVVFNCWRRPARLENWAERIHSLVLKDSIYWVGIALSGMAGIAGIYFLAIAARTTASFSINHFLQQLTPYAVWTVLLSAQTIIAVRWLRHGKSLKGFVPYRETFIAALVAFGFLLLIAAGIVWTRIGLKPDAIAWGAPDVPLLPSQFWLALGLTLVALALSSLGVYFWTKLRSKPALKLPPWSLDVFICLLLWVGAVWRWNAEPLKPSYYAPEPVLPNQEYYPYSDALTYDVSAQKLLIGIGFEQDVIRPIYSLFLALAQGVSGIGYLKVVTWQVSLLAMIPPLLFLLARALHHRLSGVLVGLLAIFHESNSIALAGIIDVSNAKLFMSDLPTALGVILFSVIIVYWLQNPGARRIYPFLAGGVLAVFMLIRTQIFLVLPAILVCAWFIFRKQPRRWIKNTLLISAGLLLTLSPWLWRNWQLTGKIILAGTSNPTQAGMLSSRYSLTLAEGNDPRLPGETEDHYLARMQGNVVRFAMEHPLETAGFMAAHFWHNEISTLLTLPSSYPLLINLNLSSNDLTLGVIDPAALWEQCCGLNSYVKELPYWWKWDGFLPGGVFLPLLASLFLFSVGVGAAWSRSRFVGLVPLFVNAGYTLSNALARGSGWRYNLPVDWIGMLYAGIGLLQVCFWLATFFDNRCIPRAWEGVSGVSIVNDTPERRFPWKQAVLASCVFLFIVAAIPLAERLIPARYLAEARQNALASLEAGSTGFNQQVAERFLREENAVALVGRALYPRYYGVNKGIDVGTGMASYVPRAYARLGFYLVGPESTQVVLPLNRPPANFPNAADVLVLGCKREGYVEAYLVAFQGEPKTIIQRSPSPLWTCASP